MKQFIKEHLRILLEGKKATDTSINGGPIGTKALVRLTKTDMKKEIEDAKVLFNEYPEFFGGPTDGEALIEFVLYSNSGRLVLKPKNNHLGTKKIPGVPSDIDKGRQFYYMMASLPKDEKIINDIKKFMHSKVGKTSGKYVVSRVDVAYVKTLYYNSAEILSFNIDNSYTADNQLEKNKELAVTNTNPSDEYKRSKLKTDKNNPDFKRKGVLSINEPDATESKEYKDAVRIYQNLLPLYKEKTKKGEDVEPLKTRLDNLKATIDRINPNYGK